MSERPVASGWLRATALLAWGAGAVLVVAPGCASVLSLDGFEDAVAALCQCNEAVPQFDGNCEAVLTERLEALSEPTRASWLEFYAENCANDCSAARSCFDQEGTCVVDAFSCLSAEECCGWVEGGPVDCEQQDGGMVCTGNI